MQRPREPIVHRVPVPIEVEPQSPRQVQHVGSRIRIAATALGESAFPRTVLNGLVQMVSRLGSTRFGPYSDVALTPRQEQIVELIAQGATDREIAAVLQISQSTAHKHVQNALRRLNAKTRSQLVASARQPAFRGSFD